MSPQSAGGVRYSLVLPIYNEQPVLPLLLARVDALLGDLDAPAEAIFVDDGSADASAALLEQKVKADPRYRLIKLTRNFGHQIAITAGMAAASGEAVIVMDADLQDPPEVVPQLIARWQEGYDIVYARRLSREGEGAFKRFTAAVFYKFLEKLSHVRIPRDVGDFRLIDRRALEAFLAMPEQDRFVRGMFAWLGFRQADVTFHRPARAAGETKYPLWKMVRLAATGVVGFSDAPLRLAVWVGLAVSGFALLYGVYAVGRFLANEVVAGWTSTVVVVSFLCGVNMLLTGIVGLYVGRIHAEVKRRPLYVVDKRIGFGANEDDHGPQRR
ncbi:MAG: glycosyltransferase family 2 protein [Variibacter sp.]|nr:glycosyltransferase family 2 protein [Variibacter sp.]